MNLVERVKAIITTPQTEWPVIANEPGDAGYLFPNYVAILAAIPAVCGFIGATLLGAPLLIALVGAVIRYLLTFAVVYIVAMIVDALAPTFGGQKNMASALKVTVYSYTPYWLAGVFLLIRPLWFLTVLGLYGLYLLFLGLPPLMRCPPEKALGYAAAVVVCAIVIALLIGWILLAIIGVRVFA
jgi:hypothetical protein